MAISDWSTTASSNGNSDSNINWAEGQAPSTVNDSARSMMSRLKHWWNQLGANTTQGGSSNAYTITSGESLSAYTKGLRFLWKPNADPTGAVTLNVDGIGAKKVYLPNGTQAGSGTLDADSMYDVVYDTALDSAAGGFKIVGFPDASVSGSVYKPGGTDVALADGGTGASLADPNADRILFWDDSAGAMTWLAPSTGLTISGTNLTVDSTVWTSANDGAGSGLDADTLDGVEASSFALLASPTFTTDIEVSGATPLVRWIDTSTASQQHRMSAENAGMALFLDENDVVSGEYFRIVINGSTQAFQVTSTTLVATDLAASFSTVAARIPDASVTTGTLTAAGNANRQARLTGNITMPASVFTQGDSGILMAGGSARTVTRGSGLAMYVNGSNVASATLSAFGVVGFIYYTNSAVFLTGDVS